MSEVHRLSVVYAGDPGTDRSLAFEGFLKSRFGSVQSIDRLELADSDLSGADLLVIDGEPMGRGTPQGLTFEKLSLPIVLIGGAGGNVADELGLKLGWGFG